MSAGVENQHLFRKPVVLVADMYEGNPTGLKKGHRPSKALTLLNHTIRDGDCLIWTGSTNGQSGYGYVTQHSRIRLAHRVAYEQAKGQIPKGLVIDHLCRNRGCISSTHLEAVTQRENVTRGLGLSAKNAKVTHCPKGHLYNKKNTYISKKGSRHCRKCHAEKQLLYLSNLRLRG